jgi:chaperonin GroES
MGFQPTFDRVVVQLEEPEAVSKGGIHLPQKAQEKANRGIVLAVGPGRQNNDGKYIPVSVKEGDKVMFKAYEGIEFETDELKPRKVVVLAEGSILGVLT